MKFDVLTLFPEMFEPMKQSVIGRAIQKGLLEINVTNIRDFSKDKHKKVDDTVYGGGAGMLMKPDVVYDAYKSVKSEKSKVIFLSKILFLACTFNISARAFLSGNPTVT